MSFNRITAPGNYVFQDKNQTGVKTDYIAGLSNKPQVTATDLKKMFDNAGDDLMTYLTALTAQINGLITAIEASTAASNIGAAKIINDERSSENVQSQLMRLKMYLEEKALTIGTGDMLESRYVESGGLGKVLASINADKLGGVSAEGFSRQIVWPDAKTAIADTDMFPLADSAAGNAQKKTPWLNIKNTLLTAFTNTFAAKTHGHTTADIPWAAPASHRHAATDVSGVALVSHGHDFSGLTNVANAVHGHGAAQLSGVAKSAGGIRLFLDSDDRSGAQTNDLWFSNT
jgi:hypothetical protein